jgi:hypothetical protein
MLNLIDCISLMVGFAGLAAVVNMVAGELLKKYRR